MKVLIVDDEKSLALTLEAFLHPAGYDTATAGTGGEALAQVKAVKPAVVLLDLHLPDMDGLDVLRKIKALYPQVAVVMMTGAAAVKTAVQCIKLGAEDYLAKPFDLEELEITLKGVADKIRLRQEVESLRNSQREQYARGYLFLSSPAMLRVYEQLDQVALQDEFTILITGETGTGKQHIARLAHLLSHRASKPFIEIHCAALPETLLESELFGYEAGAFTDAKKAKQGLFEAAQGGTVFLDEIGEMPLSLQTKLLKVLEQKTLRRLGGVQEFKLNVRVLAATNRDLEKEVASGRFRPDLYYRLSIFPIKIEPLRSRPGDILELAEFLFKDACAAFGKKLTPLSPEILDFIGHRPWYGNARELKNVIHRAVLMAKGPGLQVEDLQAHVHEEAVAAPWTGSLSADQDAAVMSLDESERINIIRALGRTKGNRSEAARNLGITRQTLLNKIKKFGLVSLEDAEKK